MTISFVDSASTTATNTSPFTLTLPTCLEDDIVVVAVAGVNNSDINLGVNTAGYSEVADLYQNDTLDVNLSVSWKRMGSTPDASVECVGNTGSSTYGTIAVAYVLRGVDDTTALDVASVTAGAIDGTIPNGAGITPTTPGSLVVVIGAAVGNGSIPDDSVTPPTGYTNALNATYNSSTGADINLAVASKAWSGSGEEDPAAWTDWTNNTSGCWSAVTMALRASAGPSPATGEISITGSTPAIGVPPSSGEVLIAGGTPAPGTAVPVFPANGTLTLTGGEPSISNLPVVMPPTVQMRITGQAPTIELFMGFAGTTPNMRGSFTFADTVEFSGNTAQMQGDWAFVYPHDFAGETPASTGAFEFGMEISGETPASTGAFVLEEIQYADFMGNTPVMQGAFEFGAEFSGRTPVMLGAFELEEESWGTFAGRTPAMSGSFDIEQAMDFAGKTPAMEGAFTGDYEQYGSFSGLSPVMAGSFDFLVNEMTFSGLTPAMEGEFAISVETTMIFSGETPPTVGEFFIGVDLPTDYTTTSDEIIRYRRGYDNG